MNVTASSPVERQTSRVKDQGEECSKASRRALDWLNSFLADVQTGVGPFLAIYLAGYAWDEERIGLALSVGGIAGIIAQTPAGALVDQVHQKRTIIAVGVCGLALGALLIGFVPTFGRSCRLRSSLAQRLGAIATALGIGAALSQTIAGAIVHHSSFNTGFLFLAAIAASAFGILYFFMPETREKSFLSEHP